MNICPNTIHHGDCLDILPHIPDESVHLVLFSPPYDHLRKYSGTPLPDMNKVGDLLFGKVVDGGVCVVVMGDATINREKTMSTFQLAVDWTNIVGWRMFETAIYHRHGVPGDYWTKRFRVDHEYVMIFFRGDRLRYFNKDHVMVPTKHAGTTYKQSTRRMRDGKTYALRRPFVTKDTKCRGTIWQYPTSSTEGNRVKTRHPATFPDNLARDIIKCFTKPGDIVLDPMMGSGTTCVMAAQEGRDFIGMDIVEEYIDITRRRLKNETQWGGMNDAT